MRSSARATVRSTRSCLPGLMLASGRRARRQSSVGPSCGGASPRVAALEDLYAQLRIIAIDEPPARQAGDLATQHALRGYDAVHLACALHIEGDDILLATWDSALNSAARATGQLIA